MKTPVDTALLTRLGLHEQSVLIYVDLMHHGASFLQAIASRTGLERTIIYRRLPELLWVELVDKEVSGKRFLYRAKSPSNLRSLLASMEEGLHLTIGSLEKIFESHSQADAPKVRVSQGYKAIASVYAECINALPVGGTYYRYSSRKEANKKKFGLEQYNVLRDAKNIQRLVITNEDLASISAPKPWRETIGFPSMFPFKQNFQKLIFMDRVAIIDIETYTVMIIESKMLASFEQAIFVCLFQYIRAEKEGRLRV